MIQCAQIPKSLTLEGHHLSMKGEWRSQHTLEEKKDSDAILRSVKTVKMGLLGKRETGFWKALTACHESSIPTAVCFLNLNLTITSLCLSLPHSAPPCLTPPQTPG